MKRLIGLAAFMAILFGLGLGVSMFLAQSYPTRPIQSIIPNFPGSIMDIHARVLSDELGKFLATQMLKANVKSEG